MIERLRGFHKKAPFLFFNGNTFADIGRQIAATLFADMPTARRREVISAVAHYIAGVLDHKSLVRIIDGLSRSTQFHIGDHVATLRRTTSGVVLAVLDDGRIVWQPDNSALSITALPESLQKLE